MDAFETVVAALLQEQGYWSRTSLKVELTKEEKRAINRPSSPRWELDVVGYKGSTNEVLVVECKSYLDSYGVRATAFDGSDPEDAKRYKLFNDKVLREVVLGALVKQLCARGFCRDQPKVTLCLAAGKIYGGGESKIQVQFDKEGWKLWTPSYLRRQLERLGHPDTGYENTVAAIVAKLLLRGEAE